MDVSRNEYWYGIARRNDHRGNDREKASKYQPAMFTISERVFQDCTRPAFGQMVYFARIASHIRIVHPCRWIEVRMIKMHHQRIQSVFGYVIFGNVILFSN